MNAGDGSVRDLNILSAKANVSIIFDPSQIIDRRSLLDPDGIITPWPGVIKMAINVGDVLLIRFVVSRAMAKLLNSHLQNV
jgi:hypothetical protein